MRICDKCMAEVGPDRKHCPECGVPLDETFEATEGADREVYPMLARANLLRVRGEPAQAESTCLEILRRYPNHVTANALMGDILADQGKEDEARQWFLAVLEIDPDNTLAKARLARLEERRTAATLDPRPVLEQPARTAAWVWGIFLFVALALGLSGFLAGRRLGDQPADADPAFLQRTVPVAPTMRVSPGTSRESEVLRRVREVDPAIGKRIHAIVFDPRTFESTITVRAEGPFSRLELCRLAIRTAAAVFHADPDCQSVRTTTIGLVQGRMETLLAADVRRAAVALPPNPTEAQLLGVLERCWFHPSLPAVGAENGIPPETPPPVPSPTGPPDESKEGLPSGPPETRVGPPPD